MREPPPKILLATFGTLGDLYPFVAIAKALAARGLTPVLAAPKMHRAAIEAEGLAYAPIRPDMADVCAALGTDMPGAFRIMLGNPHFILDEIYMRFLRETFEDVRRAADGAAAMLTHSLLVGANLAAETLGLPCARVALAPLHLQSAAAPSLTPSAPYIATPCVAPAVGYNRIVRRAVRGAVSLRMGRLRAFRRSLGLPATREDLFLDFGRTNGADRVFGLWSPRFAPPQADQPQNLEVVGFPYFAAGDSARCALDPSLERFLAAGLPPIVFTLGSLVPEVSGAFYDVALAAARVLGHRAVLLAGPGDTARIGGLAGPDAHICASAPHALLFPRCLCVVHHGGIGTTAEALRAGRPQVVVPFFGDQPDHAARVTRLGVGRAVRLARWDAPRATAALRAVLSREVAGRAAALATAIGTEAGVETVAEWAAGSDECRSDKAGRVACCPSAPHPALRATFSRGREKEDPKL